MSETEDKFINDTVNTNASADELKLGIFWVVKDKMITVERRERFSADTACHLYENVSESL
jgi:hypothetical protein